MSDDYIKAPNVSIGLGDVCEHGSLKRQCLTCELQEQLQAAEAALSAADTLARAATMIDTEINETEQLTHASAVEFKLALAAYEKAREGSNR